MGVSLLGWQNAVTAATLTASAPAVAGLDPSQLQNDQGSPANAWQTPGLAVSLTIDTGSSASVWRVLALARTNLTSSATLRWQVGSYDSGIIPAGVIPKYGQSILILPNDIASQTARLTLADPTNPDGFLSVALIYAGPAWQPGVGGNFASTVGRDTQVDEVTSRSGQEFPTLRWSRRRWSIAFDGITAGEVWTKLDDLDATARAGSNVFWCPDITLTTIAQNSIIGRCNVTEDIGFPYQGADARSWKANITERL